jgi:hypothetical protein
MMSPADELRDRLRRVEAAHAPLEPELVAVPVAALRALLDEHGEAVRGPAMPIRVERWVHQSPAAPDGMGCYTTVTVATPGATFALTYPGHLTRRDALESAWRQVEADRVGSPGFRQQLRAQL